MREILPMANDGNRVQSMAFDCMRVLSIALLAATAAAESATSASFRLETRDSFGGRLACGLTPVAATADGVTTGSVTVAGGGAATPLWDTAALSNGWYDLTLSGVANGATVQVAVLNGPGVCVREGTLTNGATWASNEVQVVRNWVVVPTGTTLVLGPDSVVKFTQSTGIQVDGGGMLQAKGCALADIADDTVRGDTNMDGDLTRPSTNEWVTGGGAPSLVQVAFDANGGMAEPTRVFDSGEAYGWLPTPRRTGYVFNGWRDTSAENGSAATSGTVSPATATNLTLYAAWTANTYTVAYDGNGSTGGSTASSSHTYDVAGSLRVNGYTRTGYTFAGWATSSGGSVAYADGASVMNLTATQGATVTLYARWTINSYTLTYCAGTNGTLHGTAVQQVDYNESGTAVEAVADNGYRFLGWSDGRTDNPRTDADVSADVAVTALFGGVVFEAGEVAVDEADGSVELRVLGGLPGVLCSVGYWIAPGTATAGSDYIAPKAQPQRLAWTNEVCERTITIPIKSDTLIEDGEAFYVLLGSPTNCAVGEPKVCEVTIADTNGGLTLAEALDNALLKWTTGGTAKWTAQTNVTYDGIDAAVSGTVASNKLSYVQTSVTETGTLSYAWSVVGHGVLRLYDGTKVLAAVTNAAAWETRTMTLTQNAAHTLKWEFANLGGTNSLAYLDQVTWLPGSAAGVAVTATAAPVEGGTAAGTGTYYAGAKVPLAATARPGWLFTGWTPANLFANLATAAQMLTVGDSPISVVANFTKVPVVVGLPNPPEGGAVSGSGLCLPGTSVTLKATPTTGWAFTSWSDGSQLAARTVSAMTNVTLYAGFKRISQIAPPAVANPGLQQAMVGVPYSLRLSVESESQPTVAVSGLPAGVTYSAANLTIAGVPATVPKGGVATVRVSSSSAGGKGADVAFSITVVALDARAQGAFSGVAVEDGLEKDAARGLLTLTVTPAGGLSAKVASQSGAASFAGKSWDTASGGVFRATLKTAKGETLALAQDASAAWDSAGLSGALTGGAFAAGLAIVGQRNPAAAKTAADYAAGTNALARYKGYYTVALPPDELLAEPGAAGNVPLGSGWLALTVKDGGAVALAGKLADGTALSGASTLAVLSDGGLEKVRAPFLFPLYGAKGCFSGVLEIQPGAATPVENVAFAAGGFVQAWSYPGKAPAAKPAQTEDRFALSLSASGGWYSPLTDLRAYYSGAAFAAGACAVSNTYVSGAYTVAVGIVEAALPEEALRFDPKTGAVSLSAGKAPTYDPAASDYVYAVTNPAAATLSAARATGLFSGKFSLYYEYLDQKGALQLKTVPVSHAGVLTPVRADPGAPPGLGYYLVPDTWKSPDAKPVAYPLKRSYGIEIYTSE